MDLASRASYRGQVTKLVKSATDYLKSEDAKIMDNLNNLDDIEEELSVLLDRLTAAHESLRKTNAEVVSLIKPEDQVKEAEAVAEYEDKAIATITRIKCRLSKLHIHQGQPVIAVNPNDTTSANVTLPPPPSQSTSSSAVRLKKLQPKRFSGDFKEWVSFWEQYRALVHENATLSTIDKFNYLETVLTEKAAETLAGLTPSEANYDTAITLLKEEYGNSEKIVDFTMQRLLSIQPVSSKADAFALRRLYTSVQASTRSLSSLDIPSSNYFVMLKGVLLRCLPDELRVDFHRYYEDTTTNLQNSRTQYEDDAASVSSISENSSNIIGDKQVNCLLKFLRREVESLEKANEARIRSSRSSISNSSTRTVKTAVGLYTSSSESKENCLFCKGINHETKDCSSAKGLIEKKNLLKGEGRCYRCCKKGHNSRMCKVKGTTCKTCSGRHATSMCDPLFSQSRRALTLPQNERENPAASLTNTPSLNLYTAEGMQKGNVYLQTACAYASSEFSTFSMFVRIVMDGGSQLSFIKSTLARNLNLPVVGVHRLSVIPFGSDKPKPSKLCNKVPMILRSQYDDRAVSIDAIEVPAICLDVLSVPTDDGAVSLPNLNLADARANGQLLENGISVLIGADTYWQFATGEHKRLTERLTAINTILGWTIQGPSVVNQKTFHSSYTLSLNVCACEHIQNFWKLDVLGIAPDCKRVLSDDVSTHIRRVGDRFEASLPWKELSTPLHDNRMGALVRLRTLVRKLCSAGKLTEYDISMNEMILSGIAEPASDTDSKENRTYYFPHRPVYRNDKETTKLRIVFDASAHAPNHSSLNDVLEVGENYLPDLLVILLNFRVGKFGIIADIEKAFLQISLHPSDRDSHRFLWFAEKIVDEKILPAIRTYRMTRLTFGVKSSPYILGAMIQELIKEAMLRAQTSCELSEWTIEAVRRYQAVCELLKKSFYMDDLVISIDDEDAVKDIYRETTSIFSTASMNLHKWNSNSAKVSSDLV